MAPAHRCSVISCTFNGAAYLAPMLDSLLAQTTADFEVVIVDDASTDTSRAILADYEARFAGRLVLRRHATNQGPGTACATAVSAARGDFISFIGQDDLYEPDYLRASLAALDANPTALASFGTVRVVDHSGADNGNRYYVESHIAHAALPPVAMFPKFLSRNLLHTLGGVFRRTPDFLQSMGYRNDTMNDWELCLNLLLEGGFCFTPAAVSCCRVHGGNISGNNVSGRTRFARQYTFDRDQMLRRVLMGGKFIEFVESLADPEDFLFECTKNLRADASLPSPLQRIFFAEWLEHVHHRGLVPEGTRLKQEMMEGLEAIGLYSRSFRIGGGALRKPVPVALVTSSADEAALPVECRSPNFEIRRIAAGEIAETRLHEMVWLVGETFDPAMLAIVQHDEARFWIVFLNHPDTAASKALSNALVLKTESNGAVPRDGNILLYYEDFIRTRGAGLAWRERQSWLNSLSSDRLV